MKLSIIIPVYNEERTILEVLKRIKAVPQPADREIVLVDDCSNDTTRALIENYIKTSGEGRMRLLTHAVNQGKGAAMRTGIKAATGDVILIQDADLEYDPKDYGVLLEPIADGSADVVYGTRFLGYKHNVQFFWHAAGNKFVTLLSNIFTNIALSDMMVGYKVFRAGFIKDMPIRCNGFSFEAEITAKVARKRARIYEVPISYQGRSYEEGKKIRWWMAIPVILATLRYSLFDDRPD